MPEGVCQCEHRAHVQKTIHTAPHPSDHKRYQPFPDSELIEVNTTYGGKLKMCKTCADAVPSEYLQKE